MLLQIFGIVPQPTWWHLNRIPAQGGMKLADVLTEKLSHAQDMEFFSNGEPLASLDADALVQRWTGDVVQLVAKPIGSSPRHQPAPQLSLVTTAGPDSGRIFPLSRRGLSVGRSGARAQVRDPWLSARAFDIRLSSNGTVVTPVIEPAFLWESGEPYQVGATRFALHRGKGQPLTAPKAPGPFAIHPGQPPSPPNVVLQVIGAAAPLLIGIVLMVVTGMWYFLLFSGISVIIAAVMITQYRRARQRFIHQIRLALASAAESMRRGVFAPHQMSQALSASGSDPLSLKSDQPQHPVLYFGSGRRKASLDQVQQTQRWDDYLTDTVPIVMTLQPEHRTIVVGDPASVRPIKNWCVAQLFRHTKATDSGLMLDQQQYAGAPQVLVDDDVDASSNLAQLIFTPQTSALPDANTTIIDLTTRTVEGAMKATALEPVGISTPTLQRFREELGLNQPDNALSPQHLTLSPNTMQNCAANELATAIGTGTLGLSVDLVADGPHLLITGTTGSGKSELLLTVLVGMIERYPPAEVSMILLDFKGGSSFNVLEPLPHTMSVETNHVAESSFRSLDAIAAELQRRERLFAQHRVPDYVSFRRAYPDIVLPRLVVAIDELRVLVDDNDDAANALARLAATGRSLGFHLIIATQRTQGAVNADIRGNIGATMCLRTATDHDSWEILGTGDAFRISSTTPGRAYYKTGAAQPQIFQTARYMLDEEPVVLIPHNDRITEQLNVTTDWTALIRELCNRAAYLPAADPVILPALPQEVTGTELATHHNLASHYEVIGLVDDPAGCSQYPLALGPKSVRDNLAVLSNSVAWIGTADSGIETATSTVCQHVLQRTGRIVFLDGGQLVARANAWDSYLHVSDASPDALQELTRWLTTLVTEAQETTIVITDWGSWATQMVTGHFQGFEDLLIQLLRQYAAVLTLYIFGARELAGGRMIAMIPDRLYLPMNSSSEHRMIWPKLVLVPPIQARAVLVTAQQPTGGLAVQLSYDPPRRCAIADE